MNEEKVIEVFKSIEAEQKKPDGVGFDMNDWLDSETVTVVENNEPVNVCHTTACFAGHTLINEGYTVDFKTERFYDTNGDVVDAQDEAVKILGIKDYQGEDLFYLADIYDVYDWFARHMGIDVQVLRDKVQG